MNEQNKKPESTEAVDTKPKSDAIEIDLKDISVKLSDSTKIPEASTESSEPTDENSVDNSVKSEAKKSEEAKSDKRFIIVITLKLLLISAITALLLAGVNALTAKRIAENIAAEKAAAIVAIFPNADGNSTTYVTAEGVSEMYTVTAGGEVIGYAASVNPMGFGGAFDIMVGINPDSSVAGIKIVSHSETPGLGSRVNSEDYLSQYIGLTGPLTVDNDIDVITGSTISSEAVLTGVNNAIAAYKSVFEKGGGQ